MMKHILLGAASIAVLFSGCVNVHRDGKKDTKNDATVEEAEELDVIEVLPERDRAPQVNVSVNGQNAAVSSVHAADTDQTLIQAVRRALAGDEILARYVAIRVTTKNGEVVLRGFVDSVQDKAAVEKKIKAVSGVKHVDNQLEVTPMPAATGAR